MTYVIGALVTLVVIQAAAIVALLIRGTRTARVERALRASEEQFRFMADRAPAMMWTARPDTTLDYISRGLVEFMGLPLEKVLGNGWMDAALPEDLGLALRNYYSAVEAREPFIVEYRLRRADGAYRWMLDSGVPKFAPDGGYTGYIGCVIDITERKDADDRIRASQTALEVSHREIQHLAGRLIESQDAERARLARDLHDDVSQQLAGLSIALSGLRRRLQLHASEDVLADLRALHERTTTLAENVRHLSHDLHPTVLRHAGLVAALTSYCAEVERVHGTGLEHGPGLKHGTMLKCSAEGDFASIAPEVALCLYRIAQEALRNVIVHAGASRADIRLLRSGDDAELTIVDDGKGFDVASLLTRAKGLGLVSISERARLAGGTVGITSAPGEGTLVHVRIPARMLVKSDEGAGSRDGRREYSLS